MFKSQSYTSLSDNNSMASAYSAEFFRGRFKAFSKYNTSRCSGRT